MTSSKVTIVTPGRFHSFDLAERVAAAGRLAAIYTGFPRFKLKEARIEPALVRSFPWFMTPYMGLTRVRHVPGALLRELAWRGSEAIDAHAARTLPECGLVTALSGSGLAVGRTVQRRGGIYVCDRGSMHIERARQMLAEEYRSLGFAGDETDPRFIAKELEEYETADAVTVPSHFAMRSFVEMGVPSAKLHVVPYGVDLAAFHPAAERSARFRVLFVGALSVLKGVHYLFEAFRRAALPGAELVLVGARTPDTAALFARAPSDHMTWTGILPRAGVVQEMSRASVLVLPSLQEGLALVQAQALACGCPVIATTNTGAEDLFADGCEGFIVPPRDAEALAERLERLYRDPALLDGMRHAALARVRAIGGWESYGRAMLALFDALMAGEGAGSAPGAPAQRARVAP